MLVRLGQVVPFSMQETMVPAAAPQPEALSAIESHLAAGRRRLRRDLLSYLRWLASAGGPVTAEQAQRRLVFLRMRFNADLSQLDIYADAITQRSEHGTGVWLAGLDAVATDALDVPGLTNVPPMLCYLDRGRGAAIRRARTRLPGGERNPVAVIRVPRERMIGSGIASSLVHEAGHQGATLLGLVESLRPLLRGMQLQGGPQRAAWLLWERWISEIVADLWAVARVGVTGTRGMLAVVSLPRPFMFRVSDDDPHPTPWVRVRLSAAMGAMLYPDPQWSRLVGAWEAFYPLGGLPQATLRTLRALDSTMLSFVTLLLEHRPRALGGRSIAETLRGDDRHPDALRAWARRWRLRPALLGSAAPTLAFAAVGQAAADGTIPPSMESRLLARLLSHWALRRSLAGSADAAAAARLVRTPAA
jgi:hypothetical protein